MAVPNDEEPLPYEEISLPEFAERAARSFTVERRRPGGLVLRGPCPRCGAVMEYVTVDHLIEGTLGPRSWRRRREVQAENVERLPLYCRCDDQHPRRPDGRRGCGAYWILIWPAGDD
jgi:hypothetical protein